jgi:serine/threonine protein kinase
MAFENKPMKEQQSTTNEQQDSVSQEQNKYRFGNYDLVRRIDVGGMGEVYLARQRSVFDREVAIKIIRSDLVHDSTARKRFLREAEVNAHIKHEHILPLYEFGEEQGRLFLVTPYIAGGTLSRRLQAGPLSLSEVHQLFTALVKAVAYIHRRGVVHRDLKPNNILLDEEENTGETYVRLIDFGIATIQGMAASPPLTTDGTSMGTVAYMAPERLSGIAAPSNDIFSLGVILYQMLTGRLPSGTRRLMLPQPLEDVVNRSVAPLPEGRFATAEELLKAFEQAYQLLNTSSFQKKEPSLTVPPLPGTAATLTPSRVITPRLAGTAENFGREVKTLHRSEEIALSSPQDPERFNANDYASPTVSFDFSNVPAQGVQQPATAPGPAPGKPVPPAKARRNPILAFISILIVLILLAVAGLFFFEFQSAVTPSANISFRPQVHTISQVFHIKGIPSQSKVDANTATVPVKTLSVSRSGTQTGDTTQECLLPGFGCQNLVTSDDVNRVSGQLEQNLGAQISQNLKGQLAGLGASQVSSIVFTTTSSTSDPQVGADSKTVTVSMTEQGQVAYFLNRDAQQLARLLLNQQVQKLGPDYTLIGSYTQIGQPVVDGLDNSSQVSIKIAGAGLVQYHFPPAQLNSIKNGIKGKKIKSAVSYIQQQPGVDANTVAIHVTVGDTMPGDIEHMKITTANPVNYPSVQLPKA